VRLLGVGLSKTGTTSLHWALQILGYRSLHYDDRRLNDVVQGVAKRPEFRRYDDVDAVLDIPAAIFFEEILAAYPHAKAVLTLRNEDEWWESIRSHYNVKAPLTRREDDPFKWDLRTLAFGSPRASESSYRTRYREHNERAIHRIDPGRLLVLRIAEGEGWSELCPFLGEPVPDVPFPAENRRRGDDAPRVAAEELDRLLPLGSSVLLVDDGSLDRLRLPGRAILPFLEKDGSYWGRPADADTALRELERMRRAGATHIAFAWPAFWWLAYYRELDVHLRANHPCAMRNERLVVFDLSRRLGA
jgi:hypothetical protein